MRSPWNWLKSHKLPNRWQGGGDASESNCGARVYRFVDSLRWHQTLNVMISHIVACSIKATAFDGVEHAFLFLKGFKFGIITKKGPQCPCVCVPLQLHTQSPSSHFLWSPHPPLRWWIVVSMHLLWRCKLDRLHCKLQTGQKFRRVQPRQAGAEGEAAEDFSFFLFPGINDTALRCCSAPPLLGGDVPFYTAAIHRTDEGALTSVQRKVGCLPCENIKARMILQTQTGKKKDRQIDGWAHLQGNSQTSVRIEL